MKTPLLLLLLSFSWVPFAQAQLGAKAGLNVAELTGRDGEQAAYKVAYHVGAFYEAGLAGPLAVQPELHYSLTGGKLKSALTNYENSLHYLTLPVLLKLNLGPAFVEAGPQAGLLLHARQAGTLQLDPAEDGTTRYAEASRTATERFRQLDISVVAGAGLRLPAHLSVGVRFAAGLNDINNARNLAGINDPRLQNRVFQLHGAFQLGRD